LRSFVAEGAPQDDKEFVVSVSDKSARLKAKVRHPHKKEEKADPSPAKYAGFGMTVGCVGG
jgi:hypothetical protein